MFSYYDVLGIFYMNSYHLRCLGPVATDSNLAEVYRCPYCQFLQGGSICQNKGGPLVCFYFFEVSLLRSSYSPSHILCVVQKFGGKRPELQMLIELLHDAEDFFVW